MKRMKKLLALALAGLMLAAALTGCGGKSDDALRAEALADLMNIESGRTDITCTPDARLNRAADAFAKAQLGGEPAPCYLLRPWTTEECEALDDLLMQLTGTDETKYVCVYMGADYGASDPVSQAFDLFYYINYLVREPGSGSSMAFPRELQVGFGRWTDEDGKAYRLAIVVGERLIIS